MEIQTRSEETGIRYHESIADAFRYSEVDTTVWKVSFDDVDNNLRRIRMVRDDRGWKFQPLDFSDRELT